MVATIDTAKNFVSVTGDIQLSPLYGYKPIKFKVFGFIPMTINRRMWTITKAIRVQLTNGTEIEIPEGMETDLSSSPRLFWNIAPPFGDFLLAALIHDYLYITKTGTQKGADREMLMWSNALNDNYLDNYVRFLFVRALGKSWWHR